MGKMQNAMVLTAAIEVAMLIYSLGIAQGITNPPTTSLTYLILNPSAWSTSAFYLFFQTNLWLAASAFLIVATALVFRQDFPLYVALGAIIITFGAVIYQLHAAISSALGPYMGHSISPTSPANLLASVIIMPLIIYYIMTTVEWARRAD